MNEINTFIEKDFLIQNMEREFETTIRVLNSYPEDKLDLKPSEISRSARELVWTFVMEQGLTEKILGENPDYGGKIPEPIGNLNQMINTYENMFHHNLKKIKEMSEGELNANTKWFTGPGKLAEIRRLDVLNIFLFDMVHHRGQFSVYLRMAGGRVPSIYGPSHDEPWM